MNKKALIAMSGGVDSSVAAYLTKESGCDCIGVTMKLFQNEDIGISREHTCCSLNDVEDARSVALRLDIPHYTFNFADRFKEEVMDKFTRSYEEGKTPNPCIDCNRYLKFSKLFQRAKELGCDFIVTGHYAQIEYSEEKGRYLLKKGVDPSKDQSYVLYSMGQEQLGAVKFPLGKMCKTETRRIAEEQGFLNAQKLDSQDICFVPDGDYAKFIEKHTGKHFPEGNFIDKNGNILGKHKGIIRYTIGQRKGLGIAFSEPMYVCAVDPVLNTVTLGKNEELYSKNMLISGINLISVDNINEPMRLKVKIRYRQPEQWATVLQIEKDLISVEFDEPQRAITKGQAAVMYDGNIVVGGGTII